jgi:hypothetical protein
MEWVVKRAIAASGKKQMSVYKDRAAWTDSAKEGTRTVSEKELVEMIVFLIDNMVVEHEGEVYRQCIGIPMGTDCAPFLANLYLFALEYRWMERKEASEEGRAILRAMGDILLGLNGGDTMERYKREIYGGLVLKKENKVSYKTHFLNLNITVNDGRYILTTYDKRDDFPFTTRSFPDATGNIHITKTHSVILGQLKRFVQCNTYYSAYKERVQRLTGTLVRQGFDRQMLGERIGRYYDENEREIDKKYKIGREKFESDSFVEVRKEKKKKKKATTGQKKRRMKASAHEEENQT